jgi:hypothetical protein
LGSSCRKLKADSDLLSDLLAKGHVPFQLFNLL